jgi:hypothetical protein
LARADPIAPRPHRLRPPCLDAPVVGLAHARPIPQAIVFTVDLPYHIRHLLAFRPE